MNRLVGRDVEWTDQSAGRLCSSPGPELNRKGAKNTDHVERGNSLKSKAKGKQGEHSSSILASLSNFPLQLTPSMAPFLEAYVRRLSCKVALLGFCLCSSLLLILPSHIHTSPWFLTTSLFS